jgi:hypothetical protein
MRKRLESSARSAVFVALVLYFFGKNWAVFGWGYWSVVVAAFALTFAFNGLVD